MTLPKIAARLASLAAFAVAATSSAFAAKISVNCDNQPTTGWHTYYCMSGTYDTLSREFTDVTFGTCEGSSNAGETEPVEQVELARVRINPAMNAQSPQWRTALAFDFSNPRFGSTTIYIQPGDFQQMGSRSQAKARIKVQSAPAGIFGGDKLFCR